MTLELCVEVHMAEKKTELTLEQVRILRSSGLDPALWKVLEDYPRSMLIRRIDGTEAKVLRKS